MWFQDQTACIHPYMKKTAEREAESPSFSDTPPPGPFSGTARSRFVPLGFTPPLASAAKGMSTILVTIMVVTLVTVVTRMVDTLPAAEAGGGANPRGTTLLRDIRRTDHDLAAGAKALCCLGWMPHIYEVPPCQKETLRFSAVKESWIRRPLRKIGGCLNIEKKKTSRGGAVPYFPSCIMRTVCT